MSNSAALIFGVSGQDGSLLARFLLSKGYQVFGLTRSLEPSNLNNLEQLKILNSIELIKYEAAGTAELIGLLESTPVDEIYNLSGQSSVGQSFVHPSETLMSQLLFVSSLLEAVRLTGCNAKLFNAGSGECFGDTSNEIATEKSSFNPNNPYAIAKCGAFWTVKNYREYYGLNACTGILFNHESSLRPARFVTRKIIKAAVAAAAGRREKLSLGNVLVKRDWGLAHEYVTGMWQMLQQDKPTDFILSTGEARSLQEFVSIAYSVFQLDWREHVVIEPGLYRPSDAEVNHGNASKARSMLGWSNTNMLEDVVKVLVTQELDGIA